MGPGSRPIRATYIAYAARASVLIASASAGPAGTKRHSSSDIVALRDREYPASPLVLRCVALGCPDALAEVVVLQHHGIDAGRAERRESPLRPLEERTTDSVSTLI